MGQWVSINDIYTCAMTCINFRTPLIFIWDVRASPATAQSRLLLNESFQLWSVKTSQVF